MFVAFVLLCKFSFPSFHGALIELPLVSMMTLLVILVILTEDEKH